MRKTRLYPYICSTVSLTGMRVGEIVALKWEDIKMDYIVINKSEKYDRITKEYLLIRLRIRKTEFSQNKDIEKLFNTVKYVEQINDFYANGSSLIKTVESCSKSIFLYKK
ncbi:MAG: hypothetical protein ACLT11_10840 [Blautia faecis]